MFTVKRSLLQHSQKANEKKVFLTKLWEIEVVTGNFSETSTLISSPSRTETSISQGSGFCELIIQIHLDHGYVAQWGYIFICINTNLLRVGYPVECTSLGCKFPQLHRPRKSFSGCDAFLSLHYGVTVVTKVHSCAARETHW